MTDCRQCRHSEPSALGMGQCNCKAGPVPVLTSCARRRGEDCGPLANKFEQRKEAAHADADRRVGE